MNKIKIVSDIIQSLLERSLDKQELIYQSELDTLLAHISTKAINLDTDNTDQEITLILKQMCEFFKFGGSEIIKFQDDLRYVQETKLTIIHEYKEHNPDSNQSFKQVSYGFKASLFPWLIRKIRTLKPFQVSNIDNLPPEADHWKNSLIASKSKSIHYFPLIIKERMLGILAFQSEKPLELKEFQMRNIKIVSDIIQSIIERSIDIDGMVK
jgi:transcriptional regulator with GAF, ATPase, and Fis domain